MTGGAPEALVSRFFRGDDERMLTVAGLRLPPHWWTRPFEYAWASGFAADGLSVLDAGCGVTHPLKYLLASRCRRVEAIDTDDAVLGGISLLAALEMEYGRDNLRGLEAFLRAECGGYPASLRVSCKDMTDTGFDAGSLDLIFCISVLEHLTPASRAAALREFARVLDVEGLALCTVDVPPIVPRDLLALSADSGLVPAGPVDASEAREERRPLRVFRLALRRAA